MCVSACSTCTCSTVTSPPSPIGPMPVARVRPGVLTGDRVHRVRAQRMLDRRALGPGLERGINSCRMQGKMLADATRVDGDAGVLADEILLVVRDLHVLQDRLQDALP